VAAARRLTDAGVLGEHLEMGFAMGIDVDVVVVGPIENVFHHLVDADGSRYDTWAEALAEEFA